MDLRAGLRIRELWRHLDTAWPLFAERHWRTVVAVCIGIHVGLAAYTNQVTLQNFPNSADEYVHLLSATLFSEGRLYVPSPPHREFFDFFHVINDGKYYGKYPPGWPALLCIGVLLGVPWLVNICASAATLFLIALLARRQFGGGAAILAVGITFVAPFVVFNAASYFTHPTCALFVTLGLWAFFEYRERPSHRMAALFGAACGMAFLIRPFTALVMLGPFGAVLAVNTLRHGRLLDLVTAGAPALVFLSAFMLYNYFLTGNPLLQPFEVYNPNDRLQFLIPAHELSSRLNTHVWKVLRTLNAWLPGSCLLVLGGLLSSAQRRSRLWQVLAFSVVALIVAHVFYPSTGGNKYGPRYVYEALPAVAVICAAWLHQLRFTGLLTCTLLAMIGVMTQVPQSLYFHKQIGERTEIYRLVREQGIHNAIVFLATGSGSMPWNDLTRNGTSFDGDVLYLRDMGSNNQALRESYPTRQFYNYRFDAARSEGELRPMVGR